ncbi:hypothetical protein [Elioraea rosea]|uniref:hypothetical protein n=1 Tax=Elioraea rosea TaxID=2492390 RepID=UPI0011842C9B|nr:hypothetical protein [Elioraea rosea]
MPEAPVPRPPPPEPDPLFIARFRARIDPDVGETFTQEQLSAIHTAFALRTLPRHSLDFRRSIPLPWGRFYLAIVAGPEKRGEARRAADRAMTGARVVADAALILGTVLVLAVIVAGFLYLGKMTVGLDLVPGIDMLPDRELRQILLR